MVTPKEVVEEKETADGSASSEGSTPESDEMDESDVTGVNTKDGAITSDDSLRTSVETMEYSHNTPLENEEIVKENEEITDRHPSGDGIEATQATNPTQRTVHNKHLEELNQEGQEGEGGCYDDGDGDCGSENTAKSLSYATTINTINTSANMAATTMINPIVPIEEFFHDDPSLPWQPLPLHSLEQSPCYPIIGIRKKQGLYYCKLHSEEANSIHLEVVEQHCKYKEPSLHKTKITEGMTTKE